MFATPTVVGERVYVGSCSGIFYAFDARTGAEAWRYDTRRDGGPAQFHGDALALGDRIFTGSDSARPAHVYAFDRVTGEVVWKRSEDAPETDVLEVGGHLVGRSAAGDLVALEPATGAVVWKVPGGGERCARQRRHAPSSAAGKVYFADGEGRLVAVDGQTGKVLWTADVGCAAGAPRAWRDHVYLGLAAQEVVRLAARDGAVVSRHVTGGLPHTRLTPLGDVVVALVDETELVAFSEALDRIVWQRSSEPGWSSFEPLEWRGGLVVGEADGNLVQLDPADGSPRWSVRLDGAIRALAGSAEVLYVGTLQGIVLAVKP